VKRIYLEARDQRVDIHQFLLRELHTQGKVEAVYRGSVHSGNIQKVRSLQHLFNQHSEITGIEFEQAVQGGHLSCLLLFLWQCLPFLWQQVLYLSFLVSSMYTACPAVQIFAA
jgi:hypothetical protein